MIYIARMFTIVLLAANLAVPQAAYAATVKVPVGTKMALQFRNGLDSATAKEGQRVDFRVVGDVVVSRRVVIRRGASARGTVVSITPPGVFGRNAQMHIAFMTATAVDGRPVRLSSIDITPNTLRQAKDTTGAAAAAAVGLVLLGPLGVAAAALVRGGHVVVSAGSVAVVGTISRVTVKTP